MTAILASGLAAFVAGVSASREMIGKPDMVPANGYATICFGRHVFELPYPIALRSLFPLIIGPKRWKMNGVVVDRDSQQCRNYQMARIAVAWLAFWLLYSAFGLAIMATVAALFVLTLRFDYWSNFVELLAASIVFTAAKLGIPWHAQIAFGLALGLGRETLPLLALVPGGIPLAAGALASQAAVRLLRRENAGNAALKKAIGYGECKLTTYVMFMLYQKPWETAPRVALYFAILTFAALSVPWLAAALAIVTLAGSRIDEPRVITQLLPWAAAALIGGKVS